MAQDLAALTNTWMLNPYMFDPSQQSNQFSNYNNQALPWPPTYNTGAGGPNNAATGQPIQSFQQWQQQNPGGMTLNSTPSQPGAQSAAPDNWQASLNALANPGKVTTPGATVPQATGSQPSGGVNQAFLNQAGAGQGMNQNFLSALRAIQARPQS
jgi:hypothetical protein